MRRWEAEAFQTSCECLGNNMERDQGCGRTPEHRHASFAQTLGFMSTSFSPRQPNCVCRWEAEAFQTSCDCLGNNVECGQGCGCMPQAAPTEHSADY